MTTTKAAATGLAAVALATAALTGCGSSAQHAAPAAATKALAPVIANDPTARRAVTLTSCTPSSNGWGAGGTVANPNDKAATYTIVVSYTTKSSTVLARSTTKVAVKAGETKSWSTDASFAKNRGTVCVLRGVSQSVSS